MSGKLAEDIIANVIAQMEAASPSAIAAHVVSVLAASGHSIMPAADVEILRHVRWIVDGSYPIDLKDEYADGFNAAMRHIYRALHPAASADEEGNPDEVNRWMLSPEDIRFIRTLYSQQWTKDDPKEITFPDTLIVVPREHFTDFLEFKTVPGKIGKKGSGGR